MLNLSKRKQQIAQGVMVVCCLVMMDSLSLQMFYGKASVHDATYQLSEKAEGWMIPRS